MPAETDTQGHTKMNGKCREGPTAFVERASAAFDQENYWSNCSSLARAMAPVRVLTSSLANTFFRCHFAVDTAMRERAPISGLLRPRATSFRISISRSVNGSSGSVGLRRGAAGAGCSRNTSPNLQK